MIPIVPKSLDLNEQILYKLAVDVCGKRLNRFAGLFIKTLCPFNPFDFTQRRQRRQIYLS